MTERNDLLVTIIIGVSVALSLTLLLPAISDAFTRHDPYDEDER